MMDNQVRAGTKNSNNTFLPFAGPVTILDHVMAIINKWHAMHAEAMTLYKKP